MKELNQMAYQTSGSEITSTTHIRVGNHQYANIGVLWKTTFNKGKVKELCGDRCFWFDDLKVRFPDKGSYSCSFVEVEKTTVTVGYPNNYFCLSFPTRLEALKEANAINQKWLNFDGDARSFVESFSV